MANIIEFLVKIKDLGSGPMRQLANNTESAFNRMSTGMRSVGRNVDSLNSKIDELTRTRNISINGSQISRINREIEQLEQRRNRLETRGRSGGIGILGTGLMLGGLALAGAAGMKAISAGMDRQMAGTSFQVMAGEKQGNELHKNLIGFATDTIYGNEVFGEAKTLMGFGVAAKNVIPTLKMLGDISLGNKEEMQALSLAFAQTTAAGKLMGQDLIQYSNAGFNPLQALAQKTGKSIAYWKDQMAKGKVTVEDVVGAMKYATGPLGKFHNGMQRMGETPTGKIMAFEGALETLAGTIGMKLLPALGGIATFLNNLIGQPQLMENIAVGIGAMAAAWALYTAWTERAAIWSGIMEAAAYWPLALVGVLGYAFADLNKLNDGYASSTESTADRVGNAFSFIRRSMETLVYWTQYTILTVENLGQSIGNLFKGVSEIGAGLFKKGWQDITTTSDAYNKREKLRLNREWHKAMDYSGLDDDGKKKGSGGATDWLKPGAGFKPTAGGGAPGSVEDAAKGIAGGGVRNMTINIAKQGIDQVTIHAASVTEGVAEIRDTFIQMFNQIVNSGGAIVSPN